MSLLPVLALLLSVQVAISDLYARRVSNRWLLGVGALALAWLLAAWMTGTATPGQHLLGLVLGLLALLPFYAIGWMGAGDVKCFAVLGLLLGAPALLPVWIVASLMAGLHASVVVVAPAVRAQLPLRAQWMQARVRERWHAGPTAHRLLALREGRAGIPYAAYLGVATLGYLIASGQGGAP
ncbi:prepilin peptidase [Stenotrophomonas sp.]|uniref:prepilin peptidase n=1 Tax=Stenotrophomonas sp. TaxID=69392 RepID=UPI002FC6E325